jgi:hypothetical protein
MSDVFDNVVDLKSNVEEYRNDPLVKALDLPVEELLVPVSSSKQSAPGGNGDDGHDNAPKGNDPVPGKKDYSIALALLGKLANARQRITAESERLTKIVGAQQTNMQMAGPPHIGSFEDVAQEIATTSQRALETIGRLEGTIKDQHKEYLRLLPKGGAMSIEYRDQIASHSDPVDKVDSETTAALQQQEQTLMKVVGDAAGAIKIYKEKVAKAREAYDKRAAEVGRKIDRLDDLGFREVGTLHAALKKSRQDAPDDYDGERQKLNALEQQCIEAERSHNQHIEQARTTRQERLAEIKKQMVLPSWWQKLGDTIEVKKLFTSKLEQAEYLLGSATNEKAMSMALTLAYEAKQLFDDFKAAETQVNEITFHQNEITRTLEFYQTNRPRDYAALKKRYDALEKGWSKMKPSELAKAYASFEKEVTGTGLSWSHYKGRCELERTWKEDYKRIASEVQDLIVQLDKKMRQAKPKEWAEGYQGEAKAELRGLNDSASTEMTEESMKALMTRIRDLRTTIQSYLKVSHISFDTPDEMLKEPDKTLILDQRSGTESRKAYLKERDVLRKAYNLMIAEHERLGKTKLSDTDLREHDEIRKLISKAAEIANAKPEESDLQDVATASVLVKRCNERMELLKSGGPQIDRGKLGALNDDWLKGLAAFEAKGKELIDEVTKLTKDEAPESTLVNSGKLVRELVDRAMTFLNTIDFVDETAKLSDGAPDKVLERKRARETALTKVGLVMDFMNTSPIMEKLVNNPFKVAGVNTTFFRYVRRIELEVLRGV